MTVARQTGDREGDDREADVTDDITYRDLDRSDGPALTAVNRACRIGADFSFYFERGADFFRWPDLVFDDARYVGIFRGDALRGYVMAARYRGFDGAGPSMLLYGGDARLLPADLADVVNVDRGFGEQLRTTDRFPIYGIAPAVIG